MNLNKHPDLLDKLAASYALGTLRGGARRRFETLARSSTQIRVASLLWQERFTAMTELQPHTAPSDNVWKRIENSLHADSFQARLNSAPNLEQAPVYEAMLAKLSKAMGVWRNVAFAGGLATLGAVIVGVNTIKERNQTIAQMQATPQVQYVAVLADDKSAASILVTLDPKNKTMTIKRVGAYQEATDKSLQLWALPKSGAPESLGVLNAPSADAVMRVALPNESVSTVPLLAISLEPKGGVRSEVGPTGPVLFKGALLQTAM